MGEKITGKGNIVLLFVGCALITVLSLYNKPVLMYENSYGNVLISLVTAFLGYYVLSDIAKLMHENAFLQWCGINSNHYLCGSFFYSTGNARGSCPSITTANGNSGLDCFCSSRTNHFSSWKNL